MRLSEWARGGRSIDRREGWAHQQIKTIIEEIASEDEDPTVYGLAPYSPEAGQMTEVRLYAALSNGLAKVAVQFDPTGRNTATDSIFVQTWPTAARLESRGGSEDRQPISLVLNDERVEATYYERKELIELFTAIAGHSVTSAPDPH